MIRLLKFLLDILIVAVIVAVIGLAFYMHWLAGVVALFATVVVYSDIF